MDDGAVQGWKSDKDKGIELQEVVERIKPTVLIGTSTKKGAFTEKVRVRFIPVALVGPLSSPASPKVM
jgi:malate dehydrogenase (oxaloacetate-decarboxylating)